MKKQPKEPWDQADTMTLLLIIVVVLVPTLWILDLIFPNGIGKGYTPPAPLECVYQTDC